MHNLPFWVHLDQEMTVQLTGIPRVCYGGSDHRAHDGEIRYGDTIVFLGRVKNERPAVLFRPPFVTRGPCRCTGYALDDPQVVCMLGSKHDLAAKAQHISYPEFVRRMAKVGFPLFFCDFQ